MGMLTKAQDSRSKSEGGSNLVVTLTVRSSNTESGESSVGKLTLVDLVSAESSTNTALGALHSVVDSLASGKKSNKPNYSASLLTELLQDSLGGNSKTMMFITVSPTQAKATLSADSLAFGVKARSI